MILVIPVIIHLCQYFMNYTSDSKYDIIINYIIAYIII